MKKLIPGVLLVALLVAAIIVSQARSGPLVVSGFLEADDVRLGSRVGGRVARVLVEEGDRVQREEVLVELDPFDLVEQRAGAAAELARVRAHLAELEAGFRAEERAQAAARRGQVEARLRELERGPRTQTIEAARARVTLAEAEVELAVSEHERIGKLLADGVVTTNDLDRATRQLRVSRAELDARQHELRLLEEGTRAEVLERARAELREAEAAEALAEAGYRPEEVDGARAAVAAAEAALAAADRRLAELAVRAPLEGVVESIDVRPGDLVPPDAPLLSLSDPARLWVRAYVPVDRLAIRLEDEVAVTVDAFPGRRFRGRIGFIAREAEFTPRNVQTSEQRAKQVFRIKVVLLEGLDVLRPGVPADVHLEPEE